MNDPQAPPLPSSARTCELNKVTFAAITYAEALERVASLIEAREPSYIITANLNYLMLSHQLRELDEVNRRAALIVADGMPLVWMSRWKDVRLPERIAGSDMIFDICRMAAERGYSVFLLGRAPGVAEKAGVALEQRYPGLKIAGTICPPFRELDRKDLDELAEQIRAAKPDILFAALGQPKGEIFLAQHCADWGVPVSAQIGMSLDLVIGQVSRAPRWMQKGGLEMVYRLAQEPRRLSGRYWGNLRFLVRLVAKDLGSGTKIRVRRVFKRKPSKHA